MKRIRQAMSGSKTTVAAVAVAIAAVGGGAYAAIPNSTTGVITGCRDASGGLRVIDKQAGAICPAGTTQLEWNQQGRTGPTGPVGARGTPGPAYFVRVGANDSDANRSTPRTTIRTWNYGDVIWIYLPQLDTARCAISATPVSDAAGASVKRMTAHYDTWIGLRTHVNGTASRMAVDATIACPET